jgi:excisionase family DNA binding protein
MPRTKKKSEPRPAAPSSPTMNGPANEVLTLAEAAAYLRFPETDVLRLIEEQGLPARRLEEEWRFSKAAILTWLSTPLSKGRKPGIWDAAGILKDDPYLEAMLHEIDRMRGRPTTSET